MYFDLTIVYKMKNTILKTKNNCQFVWSLARWMVISEWHVVCVLHRTKVQNTTSHHSFLVCKENGQIHCVTKKFHLRRKVQMAWTNHQRVLSHLGSYGAEHDSSIVVGTSRWARFFGFGISRQWIRCWLRQWCWLMAHFQSIICGELQCDMSPSPLLFMKRMIIAFANVQENVSVRKVKRIALVDQVHLKTWFENWKRLTITVLVRQSTKMTWASWWVDQLFMCLM